MALGEKSLFWDKPKEVLTEEELKYYKYSGQELASYFECMYTTGVMPQIAMTSQGQNPIEYIGSSLATSAGNGLQVVISPGVAMIKGRPYLLSLPLTFNVPDGAVTDILLQSNAGLVKPEIKLIARKRLSGVSLPENVKHESLIYEIVIASIDVPTASIQINPLMVTDQRLNTTLHLTDGKPVSGLCQSIPGVNTLGIWEDYQKLETYIKATWRTFINNSTTEWATFLSTRRNDFDVWFENIQAALSDDVAAKLAAAVAALETGLAKANADIVTQAANLTAHTKTNAHIATLTHTYSAGTHNLTGTIPTTGLATAVFKATSTNTEGDKWKLNGVAFTAKPTGELLDMVSSTFINGDIVSVSVDVDGKKLSFSGGSGGGGGKMMQQFKLLPSAKYSDNVDIGTEWSTTIAPDDMDLFYNNTTFDKENNLIYSVTISGGYLNLYVQNSETLASTVERYVFPTTYSFKSLLLGSNKNTLYVLFASTDPNNYTIYSYSLNRTTLTYTTNNGYRIGVYVKSVEKPIFQINGYHIGFYILSYPSYSNAGVYLYGINISTGSVTIMGGAISLGEQNSIVTSVYFTDINGNCYVLMRTGNIWGIYYAPPNSFTFARKSEVSSQLNAFFNDAGDSVPYKENKIIANLQVKAGFKSMYVLDLTLPQILTDVDIPELPLDDISANPNYSLQNIGNKIIKQAGRKTVSLDLISVPPESKTPHMILSKGDKYWMPTIKKPIEVLAIPNQPAFTITNQPQTAPQRLEIHDTQYSLSVGPADFYIEKP